MSWMAYVPLSVGVCAALSDARPETRHLTHAGLVLACAVGLPLVCVWNAVDWNAGSDSV